MDKLAISIGDSLFGGWHFFRSLTNVGSLVSILLSNALVLAGIVFLFLILLAGFNMITGAGDAQKVQKAQQTITTGLIGFIIILFAYFVIRLFEYLFGITLV
jgi:hypothetical protein